MHITFVTTHYPPSRGFGGVCEASHGLSRALAKAGVTVDVVTSDATKGARIPFDAFTEVEEPNLRIFPFKYLASEKSCFSFHAIRVLQKQVPKSDLIHVNGIFTHPVSLGAWFARHHHKPHLVAIRNGLAPWLFNIRRNRKKIGFKLVVQDNLEGADCIHATSAQEIYDCRTFGLEGPFTIIPNGIDPHYFEQLPTPQVAEVRWPMLREKTVVLFLSRLSPQKGLDLLISGWDDIKQKHPEAFLVIAGPDYMGFLSKVRQWVDRSGCPDSILLTGGIWGEDKLALYSRADMFVLPSYSENFGNVIAEALVCGTPVITTQATPWKDIEKTNCGRWVPVDRQAIMEALGELIRMSDGDRMEMGQRGRKLIVENFTWDIAARKMITVYGAILAGGRIPLNPQPFHGLN